MKALQVPSRSSTPIFSGILIMCVNGNVVTSWWTQEQDSPAAGMCPRQERINTVYISFSRPLSTEESTLWHIWGRVALGSHGPFDYVDNISRFKLLPGCLHDAKVGPPVTSLNSNIQPPSTIQPQSLFQPSFNVWALDRPALSLSFSSG